MRGATHTAARWMEGKIFQSTRPMRGATQLLQSCVDYLNNFNPRAPCGARLTVCCKACALLVFQSTRPMRGATSAPARLGVICENFNPRAPCGARRHKDTKQTYSTTISIHAPHAGRDHKYMLPSNQGDCISIHAPHAGRDGRVGGKSYSSAEFQSTRPMRGATCHNIINAQLQQISIHAPHAGRDLLLWLLNGGVSCISIHAPHAGRDRRDTEHARAHHSISIHAPHAGRDRTRENGSNMHINFNPRAPCGARQQKCIIYVLHFCNNRQSKHKNQQETSSVRTFF